MARLAEGSLTRSEPVRSLGLRGLSARGDGLDGSKEAASRRWLRQVRRRRRARSGRRDKDISESDKLGCIFRVGDQDQGRVDGGTGRGW